MMTASLRQPDAEIDGESVWRAATKSVVWRGGGAAGPPWGDRVMPLRAARHLRGLASSLSAGELRMQMRGKRVSEKCVIFAEGLGWVFSTGVKTESGVTPSLFLLTEIRTEVLTVLYQYCLLQSTFRSASIHVSSTVVWAKGLLPILLLTCDSH